MATLIEVQGTKKGRNTPSRRSVADQITVSQSEFVIWFNSILRDEETATFFQAVHVSKDSIAKFKTIKPALLEKWKNKLPNHEKFGSSKLRSISDLASFMQVEGWKPKTPLVAEFVELIHRVCENSEFRGKEYLLFSLQISQLTRLITVPSSSKTAASSPETMDDYPKQNVAETLLNAANLLHDAVMHVCQHTGDTLKLCRVKDRDTIIQRCTETIEKSFNLRSQELRVAKAKALLELVWKHSGGGGGSTPALLQEFIPFLWKVPPLDREKTKVDADKERQYLRSGSTEILQLSGNISLGDYHVCSFPVSVGGPLGYLYVIKPSLEVYTFQRGIHEDSATKYEGDDDTVCGGDIRSIGDGGVDEGSLPVGGGGSGEGKVPDGNKGVGVSDEGEATTCVGGGGEEIGVKGSLPAGGGGSGEAKMSDPEGCEGIGVTKDFLRDPQWTIAKLGKTDVHNTQTRLKFGTLCTKGGGEPCSQCKAYGNAIVRASPPFTRWNQEEYDSPHWKEVRNLTRTGPKRTTKKGSRCDREKTVVQHFLDLSKEERKHIVCIIPRPSEDAGTHPSQVDQAEVFLRGLIGTPMFVRGSTETVISSSSLLEYLREKFFETLDDTCKFPTMNDVTTWLTTKPTLFVGQVHVLTKYGPEYEDHQRILLRIPNASDATDTKTYREKLSLTKKSDQLSAVNLARKRCE